MGKQLVKSKKLVGGARARPIKKAQSKKATPAIESHYTKAVNVKASKHAARPTLDYWFTQIYSPNDVENPLKGVWNRASHLSSVGYDFGKPMLVKMSPQEFLDLVPTPTPGETEWKLPAAKKALASGEWEERAMISEGPFIDIDETGHITTHEGRHRTMALRDAGHKEMPVLIYDRSQRGNDWRTREPWMKDEVRCVRDRQRLEREKRRNK